MYACGCGAIVCVVFVVICCDLWCMLRLLCFNYCGVCAVFAVLVVSGVLFALAVLVACVCVVCCMCCVPSV